MPSPIIVSERYRGSSRAVSLLVVRIVYCASLVHCLLMVRIPQLKQYPISLRELESLLFTSLTE